MSKSWGLFVRPDTPLAPMVKHNASTSVKLELAEFKLAYHRDQL
ncbi:hypothetical protein [Nonomuraea typhae]|uniref:Uncharacterized protein n=1 Tax=Nonomuraea typhae TaxID=2603600 RepID=A0ABW7Z8E2_9ACTN